MILLECDTPSLSARVSVSCSSHETDDWLYYLRGNVQPEGWRIHLTLPSVKEMRPSSSQLDSEGGEYADQAGTRH